jgi:Zn-dependent membrane protease YugP
VIKILRHDHYHLTTILKVIGIASPIIAMLFVAGVIIAKYTAVGFALFMVSGVMLFSVLSNLYEDSEKANER